MKTLSSLLLTFASVCVSVIHAGAQCTCSNLLLYSGNAGYSQVALDDTFVYFGDNAGNIKKVPKTGGAVSAVATYPGNRVITGVAVDATHIYVGVVGALPLGYTANVGAIAAVPKTGGTFTTLTTLATNVIYLDVDGTHVYWNSYGYFPGPGWPQANGFIARVPKAGGAVELLATGLATSDNFALDGNDVYFGETGYVSPAFTVGGIKKVAKTGGAVTTLYSGVTGYVSTDVDYVYASSHFAGEIFRVPKAGGVRQNYLGGLVFPAQVKRRDNHLYFAVDDNAGANGFVGVLDVNTGASQMLQSGIPAAIAVAVDDCSVFSMGKDGSNVGTVHRICRPTGAVTPTTTFSLATNALSVSEFGGSVTIQVNRTGDTNFVASVRYNTADGTATAGSDYNRSWSQGVLEFQPGESNLTVVLPITADTLAEPDETFTFFLFQPSFSATLGGPTNVTITILDNDRPGPGKPVTGFAADIGTQFSGDVRVVARQEDGRLVVGGQFSSLNGTNRNNFARVLAHGALDASFGTEVGANGSVYAVALQADGQAVIAGAFSSVQGTSRPGCARLTTSGDLDTNFVPPKLSSFPIYNALVVQPDGKIVVGGNFAFGGTNLARLNTNGTLDAAFAVGAGANGSIYSLALQPGGKVLVGGSFTSCNGQPATNIVRLTASGAVDPTSNAAVLGVPFQTSVRSLVPLSDGRILIGGSFTNINGLARSNLARLLNDGGVDAGFIAAPALNGAVRSMAVQGDGRVLVGGDFNLPGAKGVARLHADGSRDTSFDVGAGPNGSVNQVLLLPNSDVLVGGSFTLFNELPAKRLVVLQGGALAPPVPAFVSFGRVADQFRLVFSVPNGSNYVLETSSNLTGWSALESNVSSGADITFDDPGVFTRSRRFYRIRMP